MTRLNWRYWRFKVVEFADGWFHAHLCNRYEELLEAEVDAGRHPPLDE